MGCDIHIAVEVKQGGTWRMLDIPEIYDGRNYGLFAILAGVRNRYKLLPIDSPRGLPHDADPRTLYWHDTHSDHSRSYLTLQELLDAPWDTEISNSGLVGKHQYKVFKEQGYPTAYCQWTNRPEISNSEMDEYTPNSDESPLFGRPATRVTWTETYREIAGHFLAESLPRMQRLVEQYGVTPNDVRMVFGFDS